MDRTALVIHGGALVSSPQAMDAAKQAERIAVLHESLKAGYAILQNGGNALEAVTVAVMVLEDCPLFNAGRGAVLAANGAAEMDAGIMDGATGHFGGISAVMTVRNPIQGARAVMEQSPHSILCARGAESFLRDRGVAMANNDYFITPERKKQLEEALAEKQFVAAKGLGTVGAVARDRAGNLAAATSTGGLTGKLPGRVSDSSVAGAGTWAMNGVCALSCTGTGDVFIRNATARDVACMIEYKKMNPGDALKSGLDKVAAGGGTGGIIALGLEGPGFIDFNTPAMHRGYWLAGQDPFAGIF